MNKNQTQHRDIFHHRPQGQGFNIRLRPVVYAVASAVCSLTLYATAPLPAMAEPVTSQAEAGTQQNFKIAAGALAPALRSLASTANVLLTFTADQTDGKTTSGLNGKYTPQAALNTLLIGTELQAIQLATGGYVLRAVPIVQIAPSAAKEAVSTLSVVNVSETAESPNSLPKPYAGKQVARGGRVGLLGNKDFMDTPFSTISYTAQTVEDQQARTMGDVLENNPAFRAIYPNNDAIMDFSVRGNRVKALDAAYGGLYGLMSPGVESLERIEIITGANALLNGLGAIGGVGGSINMVPKRALDTPLTRVTTQYISDSQFGVKTDISRRFGENDEFGIRFNGLFSDGDTPTDSQSRKVAMGALALDYRSEQVRLSADIGYRRNDTQVPSRTAYFLTGFKVPSPPSSGKNWNQTWSYDNTESLTGEFRGEYDITPTLTAYAAMGASHFHEKEFFANSTMLNANGDLFQRQVFWPLYRNSTTAEAGLRGQFSTGPVQHSWSVSTSGLWINNGITLNTVANTFTNIYTPVFIAQPSITGLGGQIPQTGVTKVSGIAAADTLSILDDRLQLTLGLRRQNVESQNISAVNGSITSSYDKSVTTPGVGIVFKLEQNVSIYANYIEGLQQGPTATGGSNLGQVFAPYVSKQHEAGVKVDFGRIAATLSAYQLITPNGFLNTATNLYGINGEQRTRGIELNTFGEVADGVRLLGGAAFVDGEQTKTAGGTNDGRQVTGAPKVQLNIGSEWDLAQIPGLTLSARAIYTSSQYLDLANQQSIPSWTRYDAGARYQTKLSNIPTTLRLNVQNLLDRSYWAAAVDGYVVQSSPRTVQLSATFDF